MVVGVEDGQHLLRKRLALLGGDERGPRRVVELVFAGPPLVDALVAHEAPAALQRRERRRRALAAGDGAAEGAHPFGLGVAALAAAQEPVAGRSTRRSRRSARSEW